MRFTVRGVYWYISVHCGEHVNSGRAMEVGVRIRSEPCLDIGIRRPIFNGFAHGRRVWWRFLLGLIKGESSSCPLALATPDM